MQRLTGLTKRVSDSHCKEREEENKEDVRYQVKSIKLCSDFLPLQVDVTPDNGMLQEKSVLIMNLQENT